MSGRVKLILRGMSRMRLNKTLTYINDIFVGAPSCCMRDGLCVVLDG